VEELIAKLVQLKDQAKLRSVWCVHTDTDEGRVYSEVCDVRLDNDGSIVLVTTP
jgi:hypothetical protein